MPKKSQIAEYVQHGGQWCVRQSDGETFTNLVSGYFESEAVAGEEMARLEPSFPSGQLYLKKVMTLKEYRAWLRELKSDDRLDVSYYQVARETLIRVGESVVKTSAYPCSDMFASRFKAVRVLRKVKRFYPDAYLFWGTAHYHPSGQLEDRASLIRRIVR